MFKMLVLQQCHGLSDFELEKQCIDRISFRKFLGFPEYIPDSTTVWLFRKKIIENCKENMWDSCKANLIVWVYNKKGMIQDATFIHSDLGHAKADKPKNEAKTRRSRDETWTKKGGKSTLDINFIA